MGTGREEEDQGHLVEEDGIGARVEGGGGTGAPDGGGWDRGTGRGRRRIRGTWWRRMG
jgi:hypothetical protein